MVQPAQGGAAALLASPGPPTPRATTYRLEMKQLHPVTRTLNTFYFAYSYYLISLLLLAVCWGHGFGSPGTRAPSHG